MYMILESPNVRLTWLKYLITLIISCFWFIFYWPAYGYLSTSLLAIGVTDQFRLVFPLIYLSVMLILVKHLFKRVLKKTVIKTVVYLKANIYPGFLKRIISSIIDDLIIIVTTWFLALTLMIGIITIGLSINITPFRFIVLYLINSMCYYVLFLQAGQTIGMSLVNIVVVDKDGLRINYKQALLRLAFETLSKLMLGIPYMCLVKKPTCETLSDRLSKTRTYTCTNK